MTDFISPLSDQDRKTLLAMKDTALRMFQKASNAAEHPADGEARREAELRVTTAIAAYAGVCQVLVTDAAGLQASPRTLAPFPR